MMIMWQFENAFQNLGEYFENPRFFLVSLFSGATEWDQSSVIAKRVCVCVCVWGGGGGAKKNSLGGYL